MAGYKVPPLVSWPVAWRERSEVRGDGGAASALSVARRRAKSPVLAGWFGLIWLLANEGLYSFASLIWLFGMAPLFTLIFRHGRDHDTRGGRDMVWSRTVGLNVVTLLFFFNCITPYPGLKTAQSINMFANLRLEGGVSNHLVLSGAPGPFRYLEDLVEITASEGAPLLTWVQRNDLRLTYYHLLSVMQDTPGAKASFVRGGKKSQDMSAATLAEDMRDHLHPRWVRKWFHFNVVDLSDPKPCALNR